jgi:RimJ/RimL family protein N-acetyltransferase
MAPVGGPDGVPAAGSLFERVLAPGTLEPDRTWAVGRTYVGHAWLSASEDPVPKLGFALLEAVWVRGLGVEVASALLTHAHNTLGLAIIAAAVPPDRPVP